MARLKLLGPTIIIRPLPPTLMSPGGIALAEKYDDDRMRWEVLDVGPGKKMKDGSIRPLEIKKGDRVLVPSVMESLYDWSDGVKMINASNVIAVF